MDTIHVLHVDDELDFAEMTSDFLEREDDQFTVETVTSATDGLACLTSDVDCIVSDYDMPGQNGIQFLKTVRDQYPDLPFILFTGKGSEEIASEAVSAGVTDYLQKERGTSQYTVLANRIRNAVEKYRTQRELADRQQRLNLFFEQSPLGVIEWDEEFRITRANESAATILGYPEEDLIGQSWEMIVPESDQEAVDEVASDLLENKGGYHSVNENVRKDGQQITCEWHNRVVTNEDDEVISIFSKFQDITERTMRQRELEAQVAAMEAATDGIAILDHNQEFVYMNPSHAAIYGFENPDNLLGKTWRACYDEAEIDRFEDEILPALSEEGEWRGEMTVTTAAGQSLHQDLTLTRLDDGRVVCAVRDLTDRMELETELAVTLEQYETLVENFPEGGVFLYNKDHECILAGGEGLSRHGLSTDEVVGSRPSNHYPREIAEELEARIQVAFEGERSRFDQTYGDRTYRILTLPVGDDETTNHVMAVSYEITERKRRELALEELHEATRDLMAASTTEEIAAIGSETATQVLDLPMNGILLFDADDKTLVPAGWTDKLGTELGGSPPALPLEGSLAGRAYRTGDPEIYADVHEADETFNRETQFRSELHLPLGDHGVFVAGSTAADDFDATDEALAQVFAANIEAALDRVDQRAKLQRERDRLDEFASVVSHDLRNPLNVAMGHLELAKRECDSDYLDDIERAHHRMETLIEDLLTLAREDETTTDTEPVDLAATIGACWQNVETADAALVVETEGTIHADQGRLRQLLENLIRNAVEHGGTGVTVTVGALKDGFYVADNGRGIPEAERDVVFNAGYSTTEDGTGFGLNIVKEIAEAHGWDVDVTESENGGARFEFTGITLADT